VDAAYLPVCPLFFFEIPNPEFLATLRTFLLFFFVAVYACAVRHHFSTRALKDEAQATWEETLYLDVFLAVQAEERT
jgi:hypothetical protein